MVVPTEYHRKINSMTNDKIKKTRGITLIETLIFIVLLSMLVAHMINYLYSIHIQNATLLDEVHDVGKEKAGFIATTAIIILATGAFAFILVTSSAVSTYADSIYRREYRIQKRLNEEACEEVKPLLLAKNYSIVSGIEMREFGCISSE